MAVPVDVRVTPALDPETYRSMDGVDEDTRGYVDDVIGAVNDIYVTLGKVHDAREAAESNPAWTPENRVLIVGQEANKQKLRVSRRFDTACVALANRISQVEGELRTPLVQQAALGNLNPEVRSHVKSLTRPEREKLLNEALRDNDEPTLTAILGAQPFLSGLSQIDHEHFTQKYHEQKNPHLVARLDLMKRMSDMVGRNSHLLHSAFQKAIGAAPSVVHAINKANDAALAALKIEPTA